MSEENKGRIHNIIMEQCRKMNMTGVNEVKLFDEETVVLDTSAGQLTIKGEELYIEAFSNTSGELSMRGRIMAFAYKDNITNKNLFRRIMK